MKYNIKVFRILFHLCPSYFFLMILKSICSSLSPLINIYMAAKIINELSHSNLESLLRLAIVTVTINFVITMLSNYLNKKYTDAETYLSEKEANLYTTKAYQFDYETIENPDTQKLRFDIIYAMMIDLHGTMCFRIKLDAICGQVIDLILSFVLLSSFVSAILENSFSLSHFIVIFLFIFIIIGYVVWSVKAETVESKMAKRIVRSMEDEQRIDRFLDSYRMGKDIRIYGLSKIVENIRERSNTEKLNTMKEKEKVRGIISLIDTVIMLCLNMGIYISIISYVLKNLIGVGDLFKYISYMERIVNNITGIIRSFSALRANTPFLEQCLRYLEIESHMDSGILAPPLDSNFSFEFDNVSFRYPSSEEYALKNVSLRIDSKTKLGIVGKNGSGKTTFIKLLARLYDPTEGRILLNGKDIRQYDYHQYMKLFSVVFQDFVIFPFTLGENISCLNKYNDSDIQYILNHLDLKQLSLNSYMYKTFEELGIEISGGEAQKIAIARAIYRNAPCIILDEPTAALDPLSENEIYQNFSAISSGKTSIYISHRLSSCRFCDNIIVFNSGHIVQQGSHNDLVKEKDGEYLKLWTAQAQYYK